MSAKKSIRTELPSDEECFRDQIASLERAMAFTEDERDLAMTCASRFLKKADVESIGRRRIQSNKDAQITELKKRVAELENEVSRLKKRCGEK